MSAAGAGTECDHLPRPGRPRSRRPGWPDSAARTDATHGEQLERLRPARDARMSGATGSPASPVNPHAGRLLESWRTVGADASRPGWPRSTSDTKVSRGEFWGRGRAEPIATGGRELGRKTRVSLRSSEHHRHETQTLRARTGRSRRRRASTKPRVFRTQLSAERGPDPTTPEARDQPPPSGGGERASAGQKWTNEKRETPPGAAPRATPPADRAAAAAVTGRRAGSKCEQTRPMMLRPPGDHHSGFASIPSTGQQAGASTDQHAGRIPLPHPLITTRLTYSS